MPPSSTPPKIAPILPRGIHFRPLIFGFLALTMLSFILLLIISPRSFSAQETSAPHAHSDLSVYTIRFIAMLQARSGETRQDVAVRVDQIAITIAGDVETHLLFEEDPNEDRSAPAQYPIDYIFTLKTSEVQSLAAQPEPITATFQLEWIEPDFIAVGAGQRNLEDGYSYLSLQDLRSPKLSGSKQSGQPVIVAVLDTGVDLFNSTLSSHMLEGFNFLTGTADPQDDQGQGTSVAGIISAHDRTEGSEVAPAIRLMPLKVLDHSNKGFYSDAIRAIRYAVDHGAQVINLGIGGQHESHALREVLRYAVARGVVVVSPTMNDGDDTVYYPAAYPETMAVGAVNRDAQRFSNYGDHIDVVAYGDNILTTDLMSDYHYNAWWGSSNASAIVSGVIAVLKAQSPSLAPAQIKEILQRTARDQIGTPSEDAPGWDPFYGHGLVNVDEAATAVVGLSGSNQTGNATKRDASTAATSQRKELDEPARLQKYLRKTIRSRPNTYQATLPQDLIGIQAVSTSVSSSVQLIWNAPTTNADGTPLTDLAGYKLYYGPISRNYTSVIDVGNQTSYTVVSLESGRTYYFAVTAYDASSNEGAFSNEVSAVATSPSYLQRVNTGGGSYTDSAGQRWSADQPYTAGGWGYVGGGTYSTRKAIANTTDDPLYQSERNRNFSYKFDIPNGQYDVTLNFAEIYWNGAGRRLFDVLIEGVLVLDNYDIYKAAGAYSAISLAFPGVWVQDGQLTIQFVPVKDNPKVSAIHIQASGAP